MGAAGAAVDDADGDLGEQGAGSADVGQLRPDVPVGLSRGGVCHEFNFSINIQLSDAPIGYVRRQLVAIAREQWGRSHGTAA
jgi:hypothetical protein